MNVAYPVTPFIVQGGVGPYTLEQAWGGLPPGMSFDSQWILSGTPTEPGYYEIEISARDQIGDAGQFVAPIHIQGVAPSTLPDGNAGYPYSTALFCVEYSNSCLLSLVSGSLPPGLSLSTQFPGQNEAARFSIVGMPAQAGAYTFTIRAQDPNSLPADRTYTLYGSRPRLTISKTHGSNLSPGQVGGDLYFNGRKIWEVLPRPTL
jgi:hypothetical protein